MSRADSLCLATRSGIVARPRTVSQAANGSGEEPSSTACSQTRRWTDGSAKTAAPPMVSPWPPRYFVVEWTTMSAPCSMGLHRSGTKVLSTTVSTPVPRTASVNAGRSVTWVVGLATVSR